MSANTCIDCGVAVKNARRLRCRECKLLHRAKVAREKYQALRHRIADQSEADERVEVLPVISYVNGGAALPGMLPSPGQGRTPMQHDRARWLQHQAAQQAAEPDMQDWSALQARPQDDRRVSFPRPTGLRDGGLRGGRETGPVTDWAAAGQLYRESPRAAQAALYAAQTSRFGERVEAPAQLHSGMFEAANPAMVQREQVQVQRQRMASEHMRSQGPGWR
jgi:hypothetical protein